MSSSPSSSNPPAFQSLPMRTEFVGQTDIEHNFTSHTEWDEKGHCLRNTFRGRSLQGTELHLPPPYHIAMITAEDKTSSGVGHTGAAGGLPSSVVEVSSGVVYADTIRVTAAAPQYIVWEHDRAPEAAMQLQRWIELAAVIHT